MTTNHFFSNFGRRLQHAAVVLTLAALSYAHAAQPSYMLTNLGDLVGNATIFTSHGSAAFGVTTWKLPSSPCGRPTRPARSHPLG